MPQMPSEEAGGGGVIASFIQRLTRTWPFGVGAYRLLNALVRGASFMHKYVIFVKKTRMRSLYTIEGSHARPWWLHTGSSTARKVNTTL